MNERPEDLVRLLLSRLAEANGCSSDRQAESSAEEVILDIDLNGSRYLLIRLPQASKDRVQLSPREHEIVRMVAMGHSNKIIADVLNISLWTVCTHLRRIFAKLGVGSRAAMVARLHEVGRLDLNGGTVLQNVFGNARFSSEHNSSLRTPGQNPLNAPRSRTA